MKKFLCILLMLAMLLGIARADTALITGEVVEIPNPGDVRILWQEDAFEASFNDLRLYGRVEADGTLLIGTPEKAVRLHGLPDKELFSTLMNQLDQMPTYENSVYSSLFTEAQQIELTADQVCGYLLTVINLCPLLDRDGSLRQILQQPQGNEVWATVTRYLAADQTQYPDAMALQVNVFSPLLPAILIDYHRTDLTGSNFRVAVSSQPVIDWDETTEAISEAEPGDTSRGQMISGFTIYYDDGSETYTYLEINMAGFRQKYHLEMDAFRNNENPVSWGATIAITDDVAKTPAAKITLISESAAQTPAYGMENAREINGLDGLDEAELKDLGLYGLPLFN